VALSLRFDKEAELFRFANAYARAVFSVVNKSSMSSEDAAYLTGAFVQDVPMNGDGTSESDSDSDTSRTAASGEADESDSASDSDNELDYKVDRRIASHEIHHSSQDTANSLMALGYKSNRAFVTRGSAIGVFSSRDSQSALQHQTTIKHVSTLKGASFAPDKVLLHQGDTSLLMTRPGDATVYRMDLDRGKVVEEWQLGDADQRSDLVAMVPDSKYAPLTDHPTLVGLGAKSLFRIDPRLPGLKRVAESGRTYASAPAFQCGATTGSGALAVASTKGDIRLFSAGSGIDKRAKTLLPALGDPILGVDVSESGRFLLATCARYLLFLDLGGSAHDDGTIGPLNTSYGYGAAIPAAARPIPRRLQLSPEHVAYMGGPTHLSFTKAYFSTGVAEERAIVAATGPFVITWQLKDILKGHLTRYAIKQYGQTIVADQFKYGNDRAIVVTLPQDVTLVDKKQLSSFIKK
jgi:VID27 C-terminal WD40-like domain